MKLLLATDAWAPQVNGVVRSLERTCAELESRGWSVTVLSPEGRRTLPCPTYPEIRLTLRPGKAAAEVLGAADYDCIHIATEGPLGWAMRRACRARGLAFTTSYHTRFPEYLRMRLPVPLALGYAMIRSFHGAAARTMVRTPTQARELTERGLQNLRVWPGAVDTALFRPRDKNALALPRPIAMYVGRVAPEKNLEAFLDLDLPGSKVVVGGGPSLQRLRRRYPEAHFPGYRHGKALAETLAAADVFVFPSRTDTLGLVMLEAMAAGVPVAAFPVPGPANVVIDGATGALDEDLREAVFRALACPDDACVDHARQFTWEASARRFAELLIPTGRGCQDGVYNRQPCPSPLPGPKPASTSPAN
ncbi:MAG: glycosyltransferase family 1 protein [Wenzhouxiangellaceae bacterium]|nr:glycosyltransferase family 1 protein [Wenzhouxiangellaceae bacterium]